MEKKILELSWKSFLVDVSDYPLKGSGGSSWRRRAWVFRRFGFGWCLRQTVRNCRQTASFMLPLNSKAWPCSLTVPTSCFIFLHGWACRFHGDFQLGKTLSKRLFPHSQHPQQKVLWQNEDSTCCWPARIFFLAVNNNQTKTQNLHPRRLVVHLVLW